MSGFSAQDGRPDYQQTDLLLRPKAKLIYLPLRSTTPYLFCRCAYITIVFYYGDAVKSLSIKPCVGLCRLSLHKSKRCPSRKLRLLSSAVNLCKGLDQDQARRNVWPGWDQTV